MMARLLWAFVLWSLACAALADEGEAKGNKEAARAHFRQGVTLVREGAYEAALVELKRAYELAPDYRMLFNIGQTSLQLNEYIAAIEAFESYLAQGGSHIETERRASVEASLAELQKRVATLTITTDAEGATLAIDGRQVGRTPLSEGIRVNVGRHQLTLTGTDGATVSQEVEVAGGDTREVRLTLPRSGLANGSLGKVESSGSTTQTRERSRRDRFGIALLATGGALGAGAIVTGILAKGAHDDHQKELDAARGDAGAIARASDDMQTYALTTDVLAASGGALLVTGLVLLLVPDREERARARKVSVGVAKNGLTLHGRF
jgi:tetratricopeptide (TPR) repeat protein